MSLDTAESRTDCATIQLLEWKRYKRCSGCEQFLHWSAFCKRAKSKDGLHSRCLECDRKAVASSYRRNIAHLWRYLESHPCVECGEDNPLLLEFDHLRDKKFTVSHCTSRSLESLEREIAKCQVLCHQCHRIKTIRLLDGPTWQLYQEWRIKQKAA